PTAARSARAGQGNPPRAAYRASPAFPAHVKGMTGMSDAPTCTVCGSKKIKIFGFKWVCPSPHKRQG
ncbi:hypothetical protein SAMN05421870_1231, partial [Streptomyces qinglanensis]